MDLQPPFKHPLASPKDPLVKEADAEKIGPWFHREWRIERRRHKMGGLTWVLVFLVYLAAHGSHSSRFAMAWTTGFCFYGLSRFLVSTWLPTRSVELQKNTSFDRSFFFCIATAAALFVAYRQGILVFNFD